MAGAFPWRLYGGATRSDAISGLDPAMTQALMSLYSSAPPEVQRELGLNSAYRSMQRQQELWDASDKSGKMVAAPGKSLHNRGGAVDLYGFGLGNKLDLVSQQTRDWVKANAAAHGLYFPMDYEPWHMQLMQANTAGGDTTGGAAGGAPPQQFGPAMPKSLTDWSPQQRRDAIASIESAGSGDYKALGVNVGGPHGGDRAYGRYQIMGRNIPAWSKEVLGRAVTPQEFMADPKIQDAIFDAKFGDYVRRFGEENAAQAWFGGEGSIGKTNLKDPLGTDLGSYGKKYLTALQGMTPGGATKTYPDQPASAAANSPAAAATGDQGPKKDGFDVDAFTANMGSLLGGGGGGAGAGRNLTQLARPMVTPSMTEGISSSTAMTPEAAQGRLQLALARLNSNKLWG
jgi:hypothetical protein